MNVITAIGNPILNEKLKNVKDVNVIGKDLPYQEGILEILDSREDIDVVIVSDILPDEYGFYNLINQIIRIKEEIEIIVFLEEKNSDIENFLNSKNIYKIYYLNEININNFINNFNAKNNDFLIRNN